MTIMGILISLGLAASTQAMAGTSFEARGFESHRGDSTVDATDDMWNNARRMCPDGEVQLISEVHEFESRLGDKHVWAAFSCTPWDESLFYACTVTAFDKSYQGSGRAAGLYFGMAGACTEAMSKCCQDQHPRDAATCVSYYARTIGGGWGMCKIAGMQRVYPNG